MCILTLSQVPAVTPQTEGKHSFPPQQKVRRVGSYEIMLPSSVEKAWKSWNTNFSCCSVPDLSPRLCQALLLKEPPPNFIYLQIYYLQIIFPLKLSFSSFVKRIGKGCVWVWVLQGSKGGRERGVGCITTTLAKLSVDINSCLDNFSFS